MLNILQSSLRSVGILSILHIQIIQPSNSCLPAFSFAMIKKEPNRLGYRRLSSQGLQCSCSISKIPFRQPKGIATNLLLAPPNLLNL